MSKKFTIFFLVVLILSVPFIFRSKNTTTSSNLVADDTLIIITPHNESLRGEYTIGFQNWYKARTGRTIAIDWRHIGGGREISRYVESTYASNFKYYWISQLSREWNNNVAAAFASRDKLSQEDENYSVKEAFLASNVSCEIDILFGCGVYESVMQSDKGNIVTCNVLKEHPEMFSNDTIPGELAGERLWDEQGRWFGGSLSAFGIIYNSDAIDAVGIKKYPETWMDLSSPDYFQKLAVADPTKSSSTLTAFSMLIQQQIEISCEKSRKRLGVDVLSENDERAAAADGWLRGMEVIQKIIANGRYFVESSTKPIIDVSAGNCLAGIAVDFYGFAQAQHLEKRSGSNRFKFVFPRGGCSPSPDPIAVFRGAPHPETAKLFIEYVVSIDGQKLVGFKVGTPGGPVKNPLARTPILKTIFADKSLNQYRVDPTVDPYVASAGFISHKKWLAPVFPIIGPIIKWAFIDLNDELREAWGNILKARAEGRNDVAAHAEAWMVSFSEILNYPYVINNLSEIANNKDPLQYIKFQNEITEYMRTRYKEVLKILRGEL